MKKNLFLVVLLFSSIMLYAQNSYFSAVTDYVQKPKELVNKDVKIVSTIGNDFLCYSWNGKSYQLFSVDNGLSILKTFIVPDEYKKMKAEYICKVGEHYIIALSKGTSRILGLLNSDLQLVKTLQYSEDKVYYIEKLLYCDDNFAYLYINDSSPSRSDAKRCIVKIDEQLNIVSKKKNLSIDFNYASKSSYWLVNERLFAHLSGSILYTFDRESLQLVSKINVEKNKRSSLSHPGTCEVYYGDEALAIVSKYTKYEGKNWVDYYDAYLYDYYGRVIQDLSLEAYSEFDQVADALFTEEGELVIARLTNRSNARASLSIYVLNNSGINKLEYGELDEKYNYNFPIYILSYDGKKANLIMGNASEYSLLSLDLVNNDLNKVWSKSYNGGLNLFRNPYVLNKWECKSGFCLEFTQNVKKFVDENNIEYGDLENTLIYVNKDLKSSTVYQSGVYRGMLGYNINVSRAYTPLDLILINHAEPVYSSSTSKSHYKIDTQYWIINQKGERQIIDVLLSKNNSSLQVSPEKKYMLFNFSDSFRLMELMIKE